MTTATISERIMINENVKKTRSSFWFSFLGPALKKTVGSPPVQHKQLRWRVSACVG